MLTHAQSGQPITCPYDNCARSFLLNAFTYDGLRKIEQSGSSQAMSDTASLTDLLRVDNSQKHDSTEVEAILARGARWEAMNRWPDAINCYLIGLQTCGRDPEILMRLGVAYACDPTRLEAAREALEEAYELQPNRSETIHNLGVVLIRLWKESRAEAARDREGLRVQGLALLERVAALDEHYDLAAVLQRLGLSTNPS